MESIHTSDVGNADSSRVPSKNSPRLFAVIPAAGHSVRMGRPKLLLPYRGTTVIGSVLQTLSIPSITGTYVVVRADDLALRQEVEIHHGQVVSPAVNPPDMRASVEFALQHIATQHEPTDDDGWLLIPADHPLLSPALLAELLTVWDVQRPEILVPTYLGRRGHPTLFRWSTVRALADIPADRGLNWLLDRFADRVLDWPCDHPEATQDLDTPEDYERLLKQENDASAKRR